MWQAIPLNGSSGLGSGTRPRIRSGNAQLLVAIDMGSTSGLLPDVCKKGCAKLKVQRGLSSAVADRGSEMRAEVLSSDRPIDAQTGAQVYEMSSGCIDVPVDTLAGEDDRLSLSRGTQRDGGIAGTVCHTKSDVPRLLGVSEGIVRYHASRMREGAVNGRSRTTQLLAVLFGHPLARHFRLPPIASVSTERQRGTAP